MKLTYTLDPRARLAVLTLRDSPDPSAWAQGLQSLLGTAFGARYRALVDARLVPALDRGFIAQFLGWLEDHRIQTMSTRWALLTHEGLSYGAARQLAIQGEVHGTEIEAFTGLAASFAWLHEEEQAAVPD